jgi:uncharacterized protein with von Willebrand factor type A (vWA) domain
MIKSLMQGNDKGANAQWNSLPNYLEGSLERFIPVVDTSGSMFGKLLKLVVIYTLGTWLCH